MTKGVQRRDSVNTFVEEVPLLGAYDCLFWVVPPQQQFTFGLLVIRAERVLPGFVIREIDKQRCSFCSALMLIENLMRCYLKRSISKSPLVFLTFGDRTLVHAKVC